MTTANHLRKRIDADLGEETLVGKLCVSILEYILHSEGAVTRLSYSSLVAAAHDRPSQDELKAAINYMTGDRAHVLDIAFEYADEDSSKSYPLEPSEVQDARKDGYVVHPVTGMEIYDIDNHIVQFFKPAPQLALLKAD